MTMDEWKQQNTAEGTVEKLDDEDVEVIKPKTYETVTPVEDGTPVEKIESESNITSIALFLGIASIVLGVFFAGAPWLGILTGTAAIVMGAVEKKKNDPSTVSTAKAVLVCGIVGVSLSVFLGIVCGVLGLVVKGLFGIIKWIF